MEDFIDCKGPCSKTWPKFGRNTLLRHITFASKCRKKYSDYEIDTLKQSSQERNKSLKRKREKEHYHPEKRYEKEREEVLNRNANYMIQKQDMIRTLMKNTKRKVLALRKLDLKNSDMNVNMDQSSPAFAA